MSKDYSSKMPCTFDEFKRQCAAHGLTKVEDQTTLQHKNPMALYAVWVPTANGTEVKCEIKPARYTVGYGLGKNVPVLRGYLQDTGYECSSGNSYFSIEYVDNPTVDVIFSDFFDLINIIKDIDGIVQAQRGMARKVFTRAEADQNIFEKIAKRYRNAIDNQDQDLLDMGRDLLSGDSIDHIITIGESVNRTAANSYREHIVPCIMIHNHAIDMTLAGAAYTEVAQMIKENLAIVLITNEEADLLDNTLGYRTTMPADWKFGDSIFARLEAGKIACK